VGVVDEPQPVRLRIDLGYDGSGFSGWAAQPGRRTVEEVLAGVLGRVLRLPGPPSLTVAGRTDAGVHARGQVVHTDVPAPAWAALSSQGTAGQSTAGQGTGDQGAAGQSTVGQPPARRDPVARLAAALPPDIRVHAVSPAPDGFDARFSALWRRYSYRVCDDPARADPLRRHETLWFFRRLDLAAMNEAALAFLGEHDFAAFCRRRPGATTTRTLRVLTWRRDGDGTAVATVTADAFCHNMVRALVGALLAVGEGRRPPGWPAQVLTAAARDPSVRVVAPHGLCLEEVGYPAAGELAARAAQTRRLRVPLAPGPP
jgi:tRNA pseudouridine38-40 synthase